MARHSSREIASHRQPRTARSRRASLAAASLVAAVVAGGAIVGLAPSALASGSDDAGFLAHLNGLRESHGLAPLALAGDLTALATEHSEQMSAKETIFHNPDLTSDVANWEVLGENVGMGGSVAAIDVAFDHSPEHYANEVNPAYTQVGIGTAYDSRGYLYVTLDFRKPMYGAVAPVVQAVTAPVVKTVASVPVATAPQRLTAPRTVSRGTVSTVASVPAVPAVPVAAHATTRALSGRALAARMLRTWHPLAAGSDPVANALAFSHLLAEMH